MGGKTVRIGMLGAGFIAQMHSLAFRNASLADRDPALNGEFVCLADRNLDQANRVADRFGWQRTVPTWTEAIEAGVDLFINAGPNDVHAPASIEAANAGLAVFCEKPLAGTADESYKLWKAVEATGVVNRSAYIHRFVPAIRLARQMVRSGEIGEVRQWRSRFLLDMRGPDESISWRFSSGAAGLGSMGDLGSHHIDIARYVAGELTEVSALARTWSTDPAGAITDVNDDAFLAIGTLDNGASAVFEASRVATAHPLTGEWALDGTKASLSWRMDRLNELCIREPGRGERILTVLRPEDPFDSFLLPSGIQGSHPIGWSECFAHQAHDILGLAAETLEESEAATFEDGYRVAEIVDAVHTASITGQRQKIEFRN